MKIWRARRAVLLLLPLAGLLGVTTVAWGQYASRTGNVIGTVGGACDSSTNTYGWPDVNGDILKCVSNVWTLVPQPATAAGSTGYVQFDSSGVLGASSNLFWDNANFRLGIGSSAPVVSLDLSQKTDALALPVGTQGQEPASPMNGMIRYSATANDVEAYIAGAWTTLTTGGATAAITLGTSAATPDPASSYSATTGLFSGASGQVSVTSTGNEIARFTGTGVSIGTTYVSTAAPTNGMIVQGNVGIGTTSPTSPLQVYQSANSNALEIDQNGASRQLFFGSSGLIDTSNLTVGGSSWTSGTWIDINGTSNSAAIGYYFQGGGSQSGDAFRYVNNAGTTILANINSSGGAYFASSIGIGTTSPDALLSPGGQSARTIDMVRETTASTAGNNLTLQAGGATPLGTDKAGGTLALSSGISTGTGSSGINFNIYKAAGSSGSADNAATTAMAITGAGSVGIGITTPTVPLHVVESSGSGVNGLIVQRNGNSAQYATLNTFNGARSARLQGTSDTSNQKGLDITNSVTGGTATAGSADINFNIGQAGSERGYMTIQASTGNVGIGTTAPAYLLHVGSPSAVGVVADFQNSSGYCTFSPSANGILTTCTSDVRLKKDIVDAGDALAWLGTMRIRDFTLRSTGERRTGVIAQEMMTVHPEMVRMGATGFYQVDVPDAWKLIKAIQELKADNDNLVTRIGAEDDALKAANDNIADLRASFEAYKDAHP